MKKPYYNTTTRKVLILFVIIGFIIYIPSLTGTFIFDDVHVLSDAKMLKSIPDYFKTVGTSRRFFSNRDSYAFWVLFLTEYKLFGKNPSGYKVVNLLFHILSAFIFFLFLQRLLIIKFSNGKNKQKDWIYSFSFFGGLLFLVHPVATEAVSYISGMNNGIGGFFFILGAYLFVLFMHKTEKKEKVLFFAGSITAFIISFFFKEVYLVFPVFLLFLYLFLKPMTKKRVVIATSVLIAFVVFSGISTAYLNISPFPRIRGVVLNFSKQLEIKTIATNLNAVVYSFYLNIFPKNLNIDHDLPLINTLIDWRVLSAFLIIVFVFFTFLKFRHKLPLSLFAYLSYLLLMAPSNSFILRGLEINGYDILSERNLYAPLFFFVIIFLEILWVLSKRDLKRFKNLAIVLIVLFGIRTFARNLDFQNNLTIWKASLKYSPDRVRPNYNYAAALKDIGRYEEAIPYARKAFRLAPSGNTVGLLANLYKKSGRIGDYLTLLQSALEKKQLQTTFLYHELGEYYYEKGDFNRAEKYFLLAIQKNKAYLLPRISLVYIYLNEGNLSNAAKHLEYLIWAVNKHKYKNFAGIYIDDVVISRVLFAEALYNFALGKEKSGIEKCEQAIKLNPEFTEPYLKLGEYYFVKGKDKKALYYFKKAELTPDFPKYKNQVQRMINQILNGKQPK